MKIANGSRMINRHLLPILLALICIFSGCNSESPSNESSQEDYCPEKYGCLNHKFIELFETKCVDKKRGCQFSFRELFGELDKIYFTKKLKVWFDECNTFPISELLKKTNTETCQYILFENDQKITTYLRGACLSDLKIAENKLISFDANIPFMVAVIPADDKVLMYKIVEKDMTYYHIVPGKEDLIEFNDDDCIHSP